MPDNSALILSIAKYYSPGGKAIQDVSVTPNHMVADSTEDDGAAPDDEDQATPSEKPEDKKEEKLKSQPDDQLNKALEVLKNRETKS